jgi:hypothetical protein
LSVSAEMLLLRAAGVEPVGDGRVVPPTEDAIRQDPRLTDAQRKAMLGVLRAFTAEPDTTTVVAPVQNAPAKRNNTRRATP